MIETQSTLKTISIHDDMSVEIVRQTQFVSDGEIVGQSNPLVQTVGPNDDPIALGLEDGVVAVLHAIWSPEMIIDVARKKFEETQVVLNHLADDLTRQEAMLDQRRSALDAHRQELDEEAAVLSARDTAITVERNRLLERLAAVRADPETAE